MPIRFLTTVKMSKDEESFEGRLRTWTCKPPARLGHQAKWATLLSEGLSPEFRPIRQYARRLGAWLNKEPT